MVPTMKPDSQLVNDLKRQEGDRDTFMSAINLVKFIVFPMTLNSAIELGVFYVMAKEGEGAKLSSKDIAAKLCSKNPEAPTMLDRILRLLASHSVDYCSVADDAQGISLGTFVNLLHDKVFLESWLVSLLLELY
ncbi:hypothetical protein L6164_013323 [Bauhinia variegata]|uniref:Uncharacterized protein n=1 Tax=Bauhinia variegata TaxID=167791 RepID=A0ACB9PD19_BAUVA|nr:hypothetical protein L6164_013323 [Bauhinia variegata]